MPGLRLQTTWTTLLTKSRSAFWRRRTQFHGQVEPGILGRSFAIPTTPEYCSYSATSLQGQTVNTNGTNTLKSNIRTLQAKLSDLGVRNFGPLHGNAGAEARAFHVSAYQHGTLHTGAGTCSPTAHISASDFPVAGLLGSPACKC